MRQRRCSRYWSRFHQWRKLCGRILSCCSQIQSRYPPCSPWKTLQLASMLWRNGELTHELAPGRHCGPWRGAQDTAEGLQAHGNGPCLRSSWRRLEYRKSVRRKEQQRRTTISIPCLPELLRTRRTYRSQKWRSKGDPGMKQGKGSFSSVTVDKLK